MGVIRQYVTLRRRLATQSLRVDAAWLAGDIERANRLLDSYIVDQTKLPPLAAKLPKSETDPIEKAYAQIAGVPTTRYEAARARAVEADGARPEAAGGVVSLAFLVARAATGERADVEDRHVPALRVEQPLGREPRERARERLGHRAERFGESCLGRSELELEARVRVPARGERALEEEAARRAGTSSESDCTTPVEPHDAVGEVGHDAARHRGLGGDELEERLTRQPREDESLRRPPRRSRGSARRRARRRRGPRSPGPMPSNVVRRPSAASW